jgi:glycosyltransferase involved in cell wall biosynthesis
MISFIVIGRNEGWKLKKCFDSIFFAILHNNISDYEVIYVDSQSTDTSISIAKSYGNLKIYQLDGDLNAAIARNVGAMESSGDLLYFIDGDMEIYADFLKNLITLKPLQDDYIFISGQIITNYYDNNWKLLKSEELFQLKNLDCYDETNGGAFIIQKVIWEKVNGMRTKYKRSQDIDMNYRLTKKGYRIYRYSDNIVLHHTIQYDYNITMRNELLKVQRYFFRGLLVRDHLLNFKVYKNLLRFNYTLYFLMISIILAIVTSNLLLLFPYLLLIIARSLLRYIKYRHTIKTIYPIFLFKYIYQDIIACLSAIFFYPRNKKINYRSIND